VSLELKVEASSLDETKSLLGGDRDHLFPVVMGAFITYALIVIDLLCFVLSYSQSRG
jgi:hypothetical protein